MVGLSPCPNVIDTVLTSNLQGVNPFGCSVLGCDNTACRFGACGLQPTLFNFDTYAKFTQHMIA